MWLKFSSVNAIYLYWPVVLIGLTLAVMFLPARVLYHHTRKMVGAFNRRFNTHNFLH